MMTLAEKEFIKKKNIWGERNMLNYYLNLALDLEVAQIPKIMFLSGLSKNRIYGSKRYTEFKKHIS